MDRKPTPPPQPGGRRTHRLFDEDPLVVAESMPRTPFEFYLRSTPAAPLPGWVRALLWAVGLAVALLLVAALTKGPRPRPARAAWLVPAGLVATRAEA
ncbi:hypothetical protein EP7_005417 [Isosphaeraceae bacterium EP7]